MPRPPRSNPKTRTRAIELRKELTPAERKLWANLRGDQLGVNFRRQHAIGNFIPDFVCIEKKLIIELDGTPFGRNTWSKRNTTKKEQSILNRLVTIQRNINWFTVVTASRQSFFLQRKSD